MLADAALGLLIMCFIVVTIVALQDAILGRDGGGDDWDSA